MRLPLALETSYHELESYPENLIPSGTAIYRSKLASYRKRLDAEQGNLCLLEAEDDVKKDFEIPIIDLDTGGGKALHYQYIHSPEKLTKWLGLEVVDDPNDPSGRLVVARWRDPKCRFIYIYGQNSRDKLKTTRSTLAQIMTYHQVMPAYLDFMFVFGAQSDANDLRFSGFRQQIQLKATTTGLSAPTLGRSGRHYQLCYNLKSVHLKKESEENVKLDEWSIRQAAIYHQFDVEYGTTLWIVTKGGDDLLERYENLTGPTGRPEDRQFQNPELSFRSSLSTHLLFCHWSTEDWRYYLRWIEKVLDYESGMALYGVRGDGYAHKVYKPHHIQDLQQWQDKTNEAVMVLEANTDVLKSIRGFYRDVIARKDFPDTLRSNCEDGNHTFISHLDEIINDFHMQTSRAKLLVNIIRDRKELVLQHLQGQAADRTEKLNKNLEREAVVMRIVTIVTLVYLPATFTSTFFSTDVVKYQDQNDNTITQENGSFSALALRRWLQVTIPLTALTLFVAWSTYKIYDTSRSGMTRSERMRDVFDNAKSLFTTPNDQAVAQAQAPTQVSGSSTDGSIWRSACLVAIFSKLARAHSRWMRKNDDLSLPLHEIGKPMGGS